MNGPSRRVAKVFEDKNVRLADIIGCRCAWDGCAAKISGDTLRGWTDLLAYRGRPYRDPVNYSGRMSNSTNESCSIKRINATETEYRARTEELEFRRTPCGKTPEIALSIIDLGS